MIADSFATWKSIQSLGSWPHKCMCVLIRCRWQACLRAGCPSWFRLCTGAYPTPTWSWWTGWRAPTSTTQPPRPIPSWRAETWPNLLPGYKWVNRCIKTWMNMKITSWIVWGVVFSFFWIGALWFKKDLTYCTSLWDNWPTSKKQKLD